MPPLVANALKSNRLLGETSIGDGHVLGHLRRPSCETKAIQQMPSLADDVLLGIAHVCNFSLSTTDVEHALIAAMPHHYEDELRHEVATAVEAHCDQRATSTQPLTV